MSASVVYLCALVMASVACLVVTAKRPVPPAWKKSFRIIACVVLVLAGGRLVSRQFAAMYGSELKRGFATVSVSSFRNTGMFRKVLSNPPMTSWEKGARVFPFFGGSYGRRIDELKEGIFYLSAQASLPEERRFASPPSFTVLHPDFKDRSDQGIARTLVSLLDEYHTQL